MRWISVKTRLPKNGESVLIFAKREFRHSDKIMKGWYDKNFKGFCSSECHEDEDIITTHWRPLPKPPKNK